MESQESSRIKSIDIFRGLTIFTMIFVNDLAGIREIPQWMQHMPADVDGMTFVDLAFPAFLFIVGMSIPFSFKKRLENKESYFSIWKHIIVRTSGLLILGVLMVNIGSLNEETSGISKSLWMLLIFIGAILVWNNYPKAIGSKKNLFVSLRIAGIILLLYLTLIFRSGEIGKLNWLQTKWWEILGLIGWAYLISSSAYLLFRKNLTGLAGLLALSILIYIGECSGKLEVLNFFNQNIIPLGSTVSAHTAVTISGIILSILFFEKAKELKSKMKYTLTFILMLALAGYFLRPLYGISKIHATPSWILYSSAICCLLFTILYWLIDIKKIKRWSVFLGPAGKNPLLAYLLPLIAFALLSLFGITFLSDYFDEGIIGIVRSFIYSVAMLGLTSLLAKYYIRLHL